MLRGLAVSEEEHGTHARAARRDLELLQRHAHAIPQIRVAVCVQPFDNAVGEGLVTVLHRFPLHDATSNMACFKSFRCG